MRFVKTVFMITLGMPCLAWANGESVSVADTRVPVGRIYDAVQSYSDLHDSVFVFLLRNKINNKGFVTLRDVAQACVSTLRQTGNAQCQNFMRSVIGNGVSGTGWQFTAEFNQVWKATFEISAAGVFYVDCGNGNEDQVTTNGVGTRSFTCENATNKIQIRSQSVSAYPTDDVTPVINFSGMDKLTRVSGSLGAVFPTLSDGAQPRFVGTFWGCTNLTDISGLLFDGITGAGAKNMFWGTFGKTSITSIPVGLFSGLTNASAERMFAMTFYGCNNLESIPEKLFEKVTIGTSLPSDMFKGTFAQCTNVGGLSPKIDNNYLGQIPRLSASKTACFCNADGLDNYEEIDNNWK